MTIQYPPLLTLLTSLMPGTTIQWADQGEAQPDKPFVTVRMATIKSLQDASATAIDVNGNQQYLVDEEAGVTIEAIGDNAYGMLAQLRRKFNFETVSDSSAGLGFCIFDRGDLFNITAMLDHQFPDERAQLEIRIRYCSVITDDVGIIESVSGTGELDFNKANEASGAFNYPPLNPGVA